MTGSRLHLFSVSGGDAPNPGRAFTRAPVPRHEAHGLPHAGPACPVVPNRDAARSVRTAVHAGKPLKDHPSRRTRQMNQSQETAIVDRQWQDDPRWRGSSAGIAPRTSYGCVARCRSSTPWRAGGRRRLWTALESQTCVRALGAVTGKPGGADGQGGGSSPSICPAGRWRRTRTTRDRCIPTRACTRRTAPRT